MVMCCNSNNLVKIFKQYRQSESYYNGDIAMTPELAGDMQHIPFVTVCSNLLGIDGNDGPIHPVRQMMRELAAHIPEAGQGLQKLLDF